MSEKTAVVKSIVDLAQELVRTPSRAYEDDPKDVLDLICRWAKDRGLNFNDLKDDAGKLVGGYFHYKSGKPGPAVCLDACVDTCEFGAAETWLDSPTSGAIKDGLLHGRGAADSKTAVAMFCHIFEAISRAGLNSGQFYVLLDADEHTGNFGGVKAFLKKVPKLDAVFIGYPGNKEIVTGARGFLRAKATVYGQAAHSGSSAPALDNAVVKMAQLIQMITEAQLPHEEDPRFPAGPKVTVTAVNGGKGFSQVPDKVDINIDMRLTPSFNQVNAGIWLQDIMDSFNAMHPTMVRSTVTFNESWPAYALPPDHPAVAALVESAESELGHPLPTRTGGPSNIGNYLADHDIPALCGFGVDYSNLHAANETISINSIEPVFKAYRSAIKKLCS